MSALECLPQHAVAFIHGCFQYWTLTTVVLECIDINSIIIAAFAYVPIQTRTITTAEYDNMWAQKSLQYGFLGGYSSVKRKQQQTTCHGYLHDAIGSFNTVRLSQQSGRRRGKTCERVYVHCLTLTNERVPLPSVSARAKSSRVAYGIKRNHAP